VSDVAERAFAGVAALGRALRGRELSPVELAEGCLSRIEALSALGAFAFVARDRAAADARAAESELADGRWRGLLHGIPYALADVVDTKGIPTALGVSVLAARAPERDATLAARLADQGAILVGKVAVLPLAGALDAGAGTGAGCRTPWQPTRPAGGPSPGAAAAVGAGLVPFAVAAQGAAPDPAAGRCGVTALRPTYGVLSRRGATLGSYGLGALGPVARSAEDCAVVLDAVAGPDPRDPSSLAAPQGLARVGARIPSGLRIGVLETPAPGDEAEPFAAAQETFRAAGVIASAAALPELPWVEAAAILEGAEAEVIGGAVAPDLAPRPGAAATAADYVRAARVRGEAQRTLARLFERYDLVLAPAPRGDEPDPLSAAAALGGLPVLTLPAGLARGRPAAVRLVAPPLEEARLLSAAVVFQARTAHHLQRPPGAAQQVAAVTRR
jgi:aspartyl-tRNA(Asn)/glutamyl-tRNA(Gln) amidotransferase subunit A